MVSSIALKRSLTSSLLLLRSLRPFSSFSRSLKTNATSHSDDTTDDVESCDRDPSRSRRYDAFDPLSATRRLKNMMEQFAQRIRPIWDEKETEDALQLQADLPGLGKEDVKLLVRYNTLIIVKGKESGHRYIDEIGLPDDRYKVDQIKAMMKNGVLKVVVPKKKKEDRIISININDE